MSCSGAADSFGAAELASPPLADAAGLAGEASFGLGSLIRLMRDSPPFRANFQSIPDTKSGLTHLNVAQTFLSAGSGGFPAAGSLEHGTGKSREPAGWKTCATSGVSRIQKETLFQRIKCVSLGHQIMSSLRPQTCLFRQIWDCDSPLPLFEREADGPKRQRVAAVREASRFRLTFIRASNHQAARPRMTSSWAARMSRLPSLHTT